MDRQLRAQVTGVQMTIEELGTIMQEGTGVKIVILNNNWLGNVRASTSS